MTKKQKKSVEERLTEAQIRYDYAQELVEKTRIELNVVKLEMLPVTVGHKYSVKNTSGGSAVILELLPKGSVRIGYEYEYPEAGGSVGSKCRSTIWTRRKLAQQFEGTINEYDPFAPWKDDPRILTKDELNDSWGEFLPSSKNKSEDQ